MMFFTSLLISLPYSSVRVTSRDGCSLNFTKTFYIMLRFCGQFSTAHRSSALHVVKVWFIYTVHPHTKRIPLKPVNSFLFVFFSKVQKLHSYTCTLIKAPPPMRPPYLQSGPPKAVVNWFQKFTRLHLFLLFLAICRIRFLTFINNSPIFQRTIHGNVYAVQIRHGSSFLLYLFRGFTNLFAKL